MLIDRANFARHRPWIVLATLATLGSIGWFLVASRGRSDWPGGGSLPGLTFGVVGGLLIVFEFALWGRKKLRSWRIGRVKDWMVAHIWLGLLTVPLLVLHSGFRWGGSISTVTMVVFLVVIASGVWGLAVQQILPRWMLEQVPAETIHSQIGRMADFMVEDGRRIVSATCGPGPGEEPPGPDTEDFERGAAINHLTVGAVQTVGDVQGKVILTRVPRAAIPGASPLREIFRTMIAPYLEQGESARSPLARPGMAASFFVDLRKRLPREAHEAVEILENLCDQRRQLDRQDWLHRWLHNWLWVHLPLSVALIVLMTVHIWVAWKYR